MPYFHTLGTVVYSGVLQPALGRTPLSFLPVFSCFRKDKQIPQLHTPQESDPPYIIPKDKVSSENPNLFFYYTACKLRHTYHRARYLSLKHLCGYSKHCLLQESYVAVKYVSHVSPSLLATFPAQISRGSTLQSLFSAHCIFL